MFVGGRGGDLGDKGSAVLWLVERIGVCEDLVARKPAMVLSRISELLELAPDAMLVCDRAGRIAWVNRHAETLLGYRDEELVGKPIEVVVPSRFRDIHKAHRDHYLDSPEVRSMGAGLRLFAVRKDGREFPTDISLSPVQTQEGTFVLAAVRDMTGQRRLEQAREEILALVAHDLQNSLNALALNAEVLVRTAPASERETRMHYSGEVILRLAEGMKRLIRDLLDLQRIDKGMFSIEPHTEAVGPLVEESVTALQGLAAEKSMRLEWHVDPSAPTVFCDRGRIQQVIHNLVSNAVKFSPAGETVTVKTAGSPAGLLFAVKDRGPGLSPDELPHVFERHWQAPGDVLRRGSGLGLFIVKTIVEAHRGRAWAESQPGTGAGFFFTLPIDPPVARSATAQIVRE